MYAALLEQLHSVRHSSMLHDVGNTGNQLQVSDDEYPHTRFRNVLHSKKYHQQHDNNWPQQNLLRLNVLGKT